ncbi:MAG: SufD family Fe-S cluster assembly protein [bacterium]
MNKRILITKENENIEVSKDTDINYLWIGKGENKYKGTFKLIHKLPTIKSRVDIKVVLYDSSTFELDALVLIAKGAIKTDTYLKAEVLLLSANASSNIVPSLEILENDVKAGHSAIVKEIDQNEIYYLQSRGLSEEESKEIIVDAFINS